MAAEVADKKKHAWKSRIKGLRYMAPGELKPNPKNWRTHPDNQRAALDQVLDQVGLVAPLIWNEHTGRLVDGHLRQDMAAADQELPVIVVDVSEAEEALILASLDPLSAMAGQDDEALAALAEEAAVEDGPLAEMLEELTAAFSVETIDPPELPGGNRQP